MDYASSDFKRQDLFPPRIGSIESRNHSPRRNVLDGAKTTMTKAWLALVLTALTLAQLSGADKRGETAAARKYLAHSGFRWTCEGSVVFRLCYAPELKSVAPSFRHDAQQSLQKIVRFAGAAGYQAKPLIYIFILESVPRLRELIGVSAYGASEPKDHAIFFVSGHLEALTHELSHEVLTGLWGPAEPWVAEGCAAYVAGSADVDAQSRVLLQSGYLPLVNMVNPEWNARLYPASKIYPELGSFVKYLRSTYGIARLRRVWQGGSRSIPRVCLRSLEQLEHDWQASLNRSRS